ncbi:sensor domain-containing diguanylate cyclase [Pseudothauera rhizosphaerae]|uniref:GGDEF domain-containing protein n=1 Tax=Pseudothauera rhizosphaerae TaxID=2565932 RepID=A0A4S4AIY9_9RHOO|nr:GGDEF domain-containing protein [Pseudothauera rhizosphaerae]THF59338.1 GGDEF domain-containing protein [Pseudothauera rhizosphaerae]
MVRRKSRAPPAARARRVAYAVALAVALLGAAGWHQFARRGDAQQHAQFERAVDQAVLSLGQQTALYRNALLGLSAAYHASNELDAHEFTRYVEALYIRRNLNGLRAFALNRDIGQTELPAFLAEVRQHLPALDEAYRTYAVHPPGERPHYHLVELIHPAVGNNRSLGFDLWHDAARRETIERARATGFAATPPIRLRQEPSSLAVLMLAPVNARGLLTGEPRDTVAASFRVADMVDAALSEPLRRQFALRIVDAGVAGDAGLLFQDAVPGGEAGAALQRELAFGGRQWRLLFTPARTPPAVVEPLTALLLVGSLASLSGAVAWLVMQRRQRAARMAALAHLASDCVFGLDRHGVVHEASSTALRITGVPREAWLGRQLCDGVREEDGERVGAALRTACEQGRPASVEFRTRDGGAGSRWIAARVGNHLADPKIGRILVQVADIDARKRGEEIIARMAYFDALTNLPNRRLLDERARFTLGHAHRSGHPAAVLVLDLDGFKEVNDQAGHAVGDAVLSTVATRLSASIRENDTAARLGGDEFVVLLSAPDGEEEACAAARRIVAALTEPITAGGRSWRMTASIGIALYPTAGTTLDELLRAADAAMYRIKHGSRDGYAVADEVPPP